MAGLGLGFGLGLGVGVGFGFVLTLDGSHHQSVRSGAGWEWKPNCGGLW